MIKLIENAIGYLISFGIITLIIVAIQILKKR